MTYGFLIQLVFCKKQKKKCGLLVLVTPFLSGAPPPKKNPGSAPAIAVLGIIHGAAEIIELERSTMVVIDHICHVI